MSESLRAQRVYFRNLDILRFAAAYMVVIFHTYSGWKENYGYPRWMTDSNGALSAIGKYIDNAIHNLSFGVEVFFLISGFLITYLLLQEKERTGNVDVIKFYVRRAFRIWPLYFLLIALAPAFAALFDFQEPKSYLPHLFFAGNFEIIKNGYTSAATNHLWSICVEEHFYLLSPLIIAFIPVKRIPQVLMLLLVIAIGTRAYLLTTEQWWLGMYMNTFARLDGLAIGSLLGYFYFHNKAEIRDTYNIRYLVYGLFLYMFFTDDLVYWDNIFLATMKKYVYIAVASYWMANYLFNPAAALSPKKENVFHYFGKLTYGLYMFNPVVVGIMIYFSHKHGTFSNGWVYFIGVNAGVFALAMLSYKYFEMPFLVLKEKFAVIKTGKALKKDIPSVQEGPVISEGSVTGTVTQVPET